MAYTQTQSNPLSAKVQAERRKEITQRKLTEREKKILRDAERFSGEVVEVDESGQAKEGGTYEKLQGGQVTEQGNIYYQKAEVQKQQPKQLTKEQLFIKQTQQARANALAELRKVEQYKRQQSLEPSFQEEALRKGYVAKYEKKEGSSKYAAAKVVYRDEGGNVVAEEQRVLEASTEKPQPKIVREAKDVYYTTKENVRSSNVANVIGSAYRPIQQELVMPISQAYNSERVQTALYGSTPQEIRFNKALRDVLLMSGRNPFKPLSATKSGFTAFKIGRTAEYDIAALNKIYTAESPSRIRFVKGRIPLAVEQNVVQGIKIIKTPFIKAGKYVSNELQTRIIQPASANFNRASLYYDIQAYKNRAAISNLVSEAKYSFLFSAPVIKTRTGIEFIKRKGESIIATKRAIDLQKLQKQLYQGYTGKEYGYLGRPDISKFSLIKPRFQFYISEKKAMLGEAKVLTGRIYQGAKANIKFKASYYSYPIREKAFVISEKISSIKLPTIQLPKINLKETRIFSSVKSTRTSLRLQEFQRRRTFGYSKDFGYLGYEPSKLSNKLYGLKETTKSFLNKKVRIESPIKLTDYTGGLKYRYKAEELYSRARTNVAYRIQNNPYALKIKAFEEYNAGRFAGKGVPLFPKTKKWVRTNIGYFERIGFKRTPLSKTFPPEINLKDIDVFYPASRVGLARLKTVEGLKKAKEQILFISDTAYQRTLKKRQKGAFFTYEIDNVWARDAKLAKEMKNVEKPTGSGGGFQIQIIKEEMIKPIQKEKVIQLSKQKELPKGVILRDGQQEMEMVMEKPLFRKTTQQTSLEPIVKQQERVIALPSFKTSQKQNQSHKQRFNQAQPQNQQFRIEQLPSQAQPQSFRELQRDLQKFNQPQRTRQITKQITREPTKAKPFIFKVKPYKQIIPKGKFNLQVKVKGKWVSKGTYSDINKALGVGKTITSKTIQRSFRITGGKTGLPTGYRFSKAKGQKDVYVELSKTSLSQQGEQASIQLAKILKGGRKK